MTGALDALNPLDGRYRSRLQELRAAGSESALIRYRLKVEAEWLACLADLPEIGFELSSEQRSILGESWQVIDPAGIKEIEAETNHDVKACEYGLAKYLLANGVSARAVAFLHFGCTSEDINNLAYGLMLMDIRSLTVGRWRLVVSQLEGMADRYRHASLLARTHGQPASPTTVGKELAVFAARLKYVLASLNGVKFRGKMNGAVGNYNPHQILYPKVDWLGVSRRFVKSFGLAFNPVTVQIESHEAVAEYFDSLVRLQTVGIDMCRDVWQYISQGYFRQKLVEHEVGSSTMPHKVNPIDFENAEGNFGLSNSLASHLSSKLLVSRLQRDLSDSTVLRNIGTCAGYGLVAVDSILKGLGKLEVHSDRLAQDLDSNWEVLAEVLQVALRAEGVLDGYDRIKKLTRGKVLTQNGWEKLVASSSELRPEWRAKLKSLTPATYTGLAADLVTLALADNSPMW